MLVIIVRPLRFFGLVLAGHELTAQELADRGFRYR
jgi:hypothetical protein